MQPVGALLHGASAIMAKGGKVGREDRGGDDGLGRHVEDSIVGLNW